MPERACPRRIPCGRTDWHEHCLVCGRAITKIRTVAGVYPICAGPACGSAANRGELEEGR